MRNYFSVRLIAVGFLLFLAIVLCQTESATAQSTRPLKIGVTLHPYYSWTKNVVGDLPGYDVRSILPGEIDAGDYQPRPEDIKKLVDLDFREKLILLPLVALIFWMGIYSESFLRKMDTSVNQVLHHLKSSAVVVKN